MCDWLSQVLCSDGVVYTAGQNRGGACGREKGPNPKDWAKMFTKVAPAPLPPGVTGLKLVAGTVKCELACWLSRALRVRAPFPFPAIFPNI